jgi:HEPN domain-containing protein
MARRNEYSDRIACRKSQAMKREETANTSQLLPIEHLKRWAMKAEGNYKSAVALNRLQREPVRDSVCFHCCESARKYLEAFLLFHHEQPTTSTNLRQLLKNCESYDRSFSRLQTVVDELNPIGDRYCYPGTNASISDALNAILAIRLFRQFIKKKIGHLVRDTENRFHRI